MTALIITIGIFIGMIALAGLLVEIKEFFSGWIVGTTPVPEYKRPEIRFWAELYKRVFTGAEILLPERILLTKRVKKYTIEDIQPNFSDTFNEYTLFLKDEKGGVKIVSMTDQHIIGPDKGFIDLIKFTPELKELYELFRKAGVREINEWIREGREALEKEESNARSNKRWEEEEIDEAYRGLWDRW